MPGPHMVHATEVNTEKHLMTGDMKNCFYFDFILEFGYSELNTFSPGHKSDTTLEI